MGHDGPAHLAISSAKPLLRGLGDVAHGQVTTFGLGQLADGTFRMIASEGHVVPGPC